MSPEREKRIKRPPNPLYGASLSPLPDGTRMVGDYSNCWLLPELGFEEQDKAEKPKTGEISKKD